MLCPKCNTKMVALFYTMQCDVCNPPALARRLDLSQKHVLKELIREAVAKL